MDNTVTIYCGDFRATVDPELLSTLTFIKLKKLFKLLATPFEDRNEEARQVIRDTLTRQENDARAELDYAAQDRAQNTKALLHEGQEVWNPQRGFMIPLSAAEVELGNAMIQKGNKELDSAVKECEREFERAQKIKKYFEEIVN